MTYGFEWDGVNTAKVAAHGLTTDEAEAVFFAPDVFAMLGNKSRLKVYGTVGHRFVCVVFSLTGEDTIRVTTAYKTSARRIKR